MEPKLVKNYRLSKKSMENKQLVNDDSENMIPSFSNTNTPFLFFENKCEKLRTTPSIDNEYISNKRK